MILAFAGTWLATRVMETIPFLRPEYFGEWRALMVAMRVSNFWPSLLEWSFPPMSYCRKQKAGQVLKLFTDDGIGDAVPFREARAKAFGILEREKLASVAERIAAKTGFDETSYEWEHIDGMAKRFKGQLRPVLQAVAFEAVSAQDPLLEARFSLFCMAE